MTKFPTSNFPNCAFHNYDSFDLQLEVCTFYSPSPVFSLPHPITSGNHLLVSKTLFLFCYTGSLASFLDSTYKWNHRVFVFLCLTYFTEHIYPLGLPRWLSGKESTCKAGDPGSIPGLWRPPGGGHGNLFQYSWLENPVDREACQATVHEVTKSQTQLKLLSIQYPLDLSMLSQMPRFHSFLWLIFHICICYIFIHSSIMDTWVASVFGDCRYCCSEQRGTYIFSN